VPDREISGLPELPLASLQAGDPLAIADLSAAETKKITAKSLVQAGAALIDDASIPLIKVDTSATGVVSGAVLTDRSVAGIKLQLDTVTAAEIAAGAVTGGATGEIALATITTDNIASIAGSKLDGSSVTGREIGPGVVAGSATTGGKVHIEAGSIGAADIAIDAVTANGLADNAVDTAAVIDGAITSAKLSGGIAPGKLADTTAAAQFIAGPTGAGGAVSARAIVSTDLPIATAGARGAVAAGAGLAMTGDAIGLDHTVAANATPSLVAYDQYGRVTTSSAITAGALPAATSSSIGAVSIPSGSGLTVTPTGALSHLSAVTAGSAAKVSFNASGHITAALALLATDIPDLDASKITSGEFGVTQIANRSITNAKLADYSISYIQEATPPALSGSHHIGTLWFQESTARLSMWNGNSFMPVGQGALSSENLRFCGLFDATTGLVTAVTQFGTADGLTVGNAIPPASNQLTGLYLVCEVAGSYAGLTFDAGDWLVCLGQARGYERIDTLSGGGGGGASRLGDLLDVTITTPGAGDVLVYNGTNWVNASSNDPGTY
jgi:hypothetical protein